MPEPLPAVSIRAALRRPSSDVAPTPSTWGDDEPLPIRTMELIERVDGPFTLRAIAMLDDTIDPRGLLGARFELSFGRPDDEPRHVHGVVLRAELLGTDDHRAHVQLEVGPAIVAAELAPHSAVFQDLSIVEIAHRLLGRAAAARGLDLELVELGCPHFEPVDYAVQWRESDLDFVARLLAEHGVTWLVEPKSADDGPAHERVVLLGPAARWPGAGARPFTEGAHREPPTHAMAHGREAVAVEETVTTLRVASSVPPRGWEWSAWDWSSVAPGQLRGHAPQPEPPDAAEVGYDHDARRLVERDRAVQDDTPVRASLRLAAARARAAACQGRSDIVALRAGTVFDVHGQACAALDGRYAVTRVVHRADFVHGHEGAEHGARYHNEFVCVPQQVGHTPQLRPRPRIDGPHSAIVVGPDHEEIHTDVHGRIRVRFGWDRTPATGGSCWLRVAQAWAGQGFGALVLPRVGMEVLVAFIDGDPDRPVCTGCLYDGAQVTPEFLPDARTRTTLRSNSTPGGGGYNELTIEDAAGHERIYVRAQRDFVEQIRADHRVTVGVDDSIVVGRDQRLEVKGNQTQRITGDVDRRIEGKREQVVLGDDFAQIEGRDTRHVHGGQIVFVGCESGPALLRVDGVRQLQASGAVEIAVGPFMAPTAGVSVTPSTTRLWVGGSAITLLPDRIVLEADTIVLASQGGELKLDQSALLRSTQAVVLARGADGEASCRVQLDGDALLQGECTDIRADASLSLCAAGGQGGTTIDCNAHTAFHNTKTRLEDAAGGFVEVTTGFVHSNG